MRNTITTAALCLFMALPGASLLAADEAQVDEKIALPKIPLAPPAPERILPQEGTRRSDDAPVPAPTIPGTPGTVILVPLPQGSGGTIVPPAPTREPPTPGQTGPVPHPPGADPSDTAAPAVLPVIPLPPDKTLPAVVPAMPVPSDKTSPAVLPALPVPSQAPESGIALTPPPPRQETTPRKEAVAPRAASPAPGPPAAVSEPGKQPSPLDFLPMPTLLVPDKTQGEPKAGKGTQPDKAILGEPKTQTPPQAEQAKAEAGVPLRIPPDAAKNGDLTFLEGCWRGTGNECPSNRGFTAHFCFDKNGDGKRIYDDPKLGKCTGAVKSKFDAQGRLIISCERAPCVRGNAYGSGVLICEEVGNATRCVSPKCSNPLHLARE